MQAQKFSLRRRAKSFHFAFDGLYQFFSTQHNAIVHAIATGIVIGLSFMLTLSATELLFITVSIAMVWMAELFNTCIEKLCDMICPKRHPKIKFIKDVSAAGVLVTAIMAIIVGCIIFIPKLL
jgi:diacylglycerol kinase (ATP)